MNKKLDRIEAHLRTLFEDKLLNIFTGQKTQVRLIDDLVQVMRENLKHNLEGVTLAPDRFVIQVPRNELLEWQAHQDILNEMANSLFQIGCKENLSFQKPPRIEIHIGSDVPKHNYIISAHISPEDPNLPDTAGMTQTEQRPGKKIIPDNASLIIGGRTSFPLDKAVINIGRHSTNDLVLDDPHVSRHHAQLRGIRNQFVIFDVGSTGGTFLNGRKITQSTLQTGDVIRIGVINLIYIQDTTSANITTAMQVEGETKPPQEGQK